MRASRAGVEGGASVFRCFGEAVGRWAEDGKRKAAGGGDMGEPIQSFREFLPSTPCSPLLALCTQPLHRWPDRGMLMP